MNEDLNLYVDENVSETEDDFDENIKISLIFMDAYIFSEEFADIGELRLGIPGKVAGFALGGVLGAAKGVFDVCKYSILNALASGRISKKI